jgi:hypothetical protein
MYRPSEGMKNTGRYGWRDKMYTADEGACCLEQKTFLVRERS